MLVIQKYGTRRTDAFLERLTTTIIFQRTFVTSLLRWGLISVSLYFSLGNLTDIIFTVNIRIVCVGICNCVAWCDSYLKNINFYFYSIFVSFKVHLYKITISLLGRIYTLPQFVGPCLLWPNGRPSQLLLRSCSLLTSCATKGSVAEGEHDANSKTTTNISLP